MKTLNQQVKTSGKLLWSLALAALVLVGCSRAPQGPKMVQIQGQVLLDGEVIETGSISFDPADGKGGAAVCQIENGKYLMKTELGEKKVSIVSYREGKGKDPFGFQIQDQIIPAKFNSKSTLKYTVQDQEKTDYNFELNSKSK